ncbi:hypothetical protein ACQPXT_40680 (plasmid) [Streptomyces sp. CA-100214]
MAQTKFDKQVEESADSLVRGIGRILAGRDLDGVKRTDATFWRSGTRVLPKVEGKVRRRSYTPASPTCGRRTCRRSPTEATSPASTTPWSASAPSFSAASPSTATSTVCRG